MPSPYDRVFEPKPGRIFVFGSNRAGIHGAGAASYAYRYQGAEWEEGEGLFGESYAIPTKGKRIETLPLDEIKKHVDKFIEFAKSRPDLEFFVTRIGCGLAGYEDHDIAPMFVDAPDNCILPIKWGKEKAEAVNRIDSFSGEYRFLSNFWFAEVTIYNVTYPTVEHAYQAMKSGDPAYQHRVQTAKGPKEAKDLGKKAVLRPDWEQVKVDYMKYLVWEKFSKHQGLKDKLLATGDAELIEGNTWGDTFWGVCRGTGQNMLGKILMEVRTMLRTGHVPTT